MRHRIVWALAVVMLVTCAPLRAEPAGPDADGPAPAGPAEKPGGNVAAVAARGLRCSYYMNGRIYVNVLGTPEGKPITVPPVEGWEDFKPSWSKTGDRLVFFRRGKNAPVVSNWKTILCVIKTDGTDLQQLTDDTHTNFNPTWTRDGTNRPIWNRRNDQAGGYIVMWSQVGAKPGQEVAVSDPRYHTWVHTCLADGRILVESAHPEQGWGYYLMTPKPGGAAGTNSKGEFPMTRLLFNGRLLMAAAAILLCSHGAGAADAEVAAAGRPDAARAIPTFHCLGLYWSPEGGAADKEVEVRFRPQGAEAWRDGLPMRYNPIPKTDEDLTDYRGSIVHLKPGTTYEIALALAGTQERARLTATTWSEAFPVGETVRVADRDTPLAIAESGTPEAWRVYDGRGATIDVRHRHDACMTIDAAYVVVRGFTLKGAGSEQNTRRSAVGAIRIEGGHDIVIEDCDVSDWGRLNRERGFGYNMDSAILSRSSGLRRLIVQRCKLHHPTYDGSTWYEPTHPTHTRGPQCIALFNTAGNHVIRYNECTSDLEHMYNDVIGGGSNGSFRGSPGHDSDIYGNLVSHCWDDGLEVEGGNRNVRVWGNYIAQSAVMIGNAATSIGPLYVWRNVCARSQWKPDYHGGYFLKMGFAGGEHWMTGHQYIFHNTVFRSDKWLPTGGLGGNRIVKHTVSRNNILHVFSPDNRSASEAKQNVDNDFDYDLYNGRVPAGHEAHGVRGEPVYADGAGFDSATGTGRFQLAPTSPGAGAGDPLPNFSTGYTGAAPDIGAHQRGAPPMRYGVEAGTP